MHNRMGGLLSFIHMQSQSNEHPLHNSSRTWPSLKALQQCGLFYPTTALKDPLYSLPNSSFIRSPSGIKSTAAHHVHILASNYLGLFICEWRAWKMSLPEQLTVILRPTSDFPARIWIMTSSGDLLASETRGQSVTGSGVCFPSVEEVTASSEVLSTSDFRPSDTALR